MKSNAIISFYKGYVMAILLSMTTIMYGLNVARSIIQEKTSRIFEVMLAIAKPGDMLAGKLIGVGAVGLTQILIWVFAGAAILGSAFAAPILSGDFAVHFSWVEAYCFRCISCSDTSCTVLSSRASPPHAKPSKNCKCTPHSQPSPYGSALR